jgi:hypothetical protein
LTASRRGRHREAATLAWAQVQDSVQERSGLPDALAREICRSFSMEAAFGMRRSGEAIFRRRKRTHNVLRSQSEMKKLAMDATDGEIGSIEDFYFDDESWTIRYMVVKAGNWLSGRSVLISPLSVREVDWDRNKLSLDLTKKQIENSPGIDTQKPVSRQYEMAYMGYYGYPYYWGGPSMWGMQVYPGEMAANPVPLEPGKTEDGKDNADTHLRSAAAVKSYHIDTLDGEIGHVEDFLVEQETWNIRYLEVATHNWLPGKKVLISSEHIQSVSWLDAKILVNVARETIQSAPEYVGSRRITIEDEKQLMNHYSLTPYGVRVEKRLHL